MGFYICCPKCGEETLDDGTLTCSNCKWYEGKDQEDEIAALRAQLTEAERERDEARADVARLRAERDEVDYYCGCEHHCYGSTAEAAWDEDGCCEVCGVDVDPWTICALQARDEVARLRESRDTALAEYRALREKCKYPWCDRDQVVAERDKARAEVERLRELLVRIVKYAVEDRAWTPGTTRLARAILEARRLLGIPDGASHSGEEE